jgi:hypothetical protein
VGQRNRYRQAIDRRSMGHRNGHHRLIAAHPLLHISLGTLHPGDRLAPLMMGQGPVDTAHLRAMALVRLADRRSGRQHPLAMHPLPGLIRAQP